MSAVLVTGGGGFIGLALVEAIAERGDNAIAFDLAFPAGYDPPPRVKIVRGDVTDAAGVIAAVHANNVDRIIHAAAIVGVAPSIEMATTVIRVNVEGSINVFEAARIHSVGRVIHMSSEEVYGRYATPVVTEESPTFPLTTYGATKLATEHFSRAWGTAHGLDIINLRIGCVYGARLPRARMPKILVDAVAEDRELHLAEGGDSPMDHTYVADIVAGALAALEHQQHPFDTYNIGTGIASTGFDVVAALKALVPTARISIGRGEIKHPGGYDMPRKGAIGIERATTVFGYRPRFDLRAGLAAYLASYER